MIFLNIQVFKIVISNVKMDGFHIKMGFFWIIVEINFYRNWLFIKVDI